MTSTISDAPLLLDTHALLWYAQGTTERLARRLIGRLDAAAQGDGLRASALSVRELGHLIRRGRIAIGMDLRSWVARLGSACGVVVVPVDAEIARLSAELPGNPPRDPADQVIIATARSYGWTLVTRDRVMLDYGRLGHVRVLEA